MTRLITIDSGTTNTRICLVENDKILQTLSFPVGATKSVDNKTLLASTIKDGICTLLQNHNLQERDISCIICCGMITSEFGLVNLPHIPLPAGIEELRQTMHRCNIPEISDIPFLFIRGVKTDFETLEKADVMRGEETEIMGIFAGPGLYILPGSHNKLITVGENCRITDFRTTLTGEMLQAIASGTILKDAVTLDDYQIDEKRLLEGYHYARSHGISEALFKVRVFKNHFQKTEAAVYSFYLGILLQCEVDNILAAPAQNIYIGGKKAIKNAIALLLGALSEKNIIVIPNSIVETSLVTGMCKLYKGEN